MEGLTDELIARNPHIGDLPMVCAHMPSGGSQHLGDDRAWIEVSKHPLNSRPLFSLRGATRCGANDFHIGHAQEA
jgi:hypothetical protein